MSSTHPRNLIDLTEEIAAKSEGNVEPSSNAIVLLESPPRDSLDNNPFDCIQRLVVNRQDDPFESVATEARLQRRSAIPPKEVEVENLLGLNEDSVASAQLMATPNRFPFKNDKADFSDLENESPPSFMNVKGGRGSCSTTPDSVGSGSGGSSGETVSMSKFKKSLGGRDRLLKLSISNSTFSSPLTHLTSSYQFVSPDITPLSKNGQSFSKIGQNSSTNNASEANFDADLELLTIPMLKNFTPEEATPKSEAADAADGNVADTSEVSSVKTPPDLSTLREKMRQRNKNLNNAPQLIEQLNTLLCNSDGIDERKRNEAKTLLESLSKVITSTKQEASTTPIPKSIKRQATFDIDRDEAQNSSNQHETEAEQINVVQKDMSNAHPSDEETKDITKRSSETYIGESAAANLDLDLPEIAITSPSTSESEINVTDLLSRLQTLLQLHNSTNDSGVDENSTEILSPSNPTFIVVVPTTTASVAKFNESCVEDLIEMDMSSMRRRSQSLSVHDKLKIVRLPLSGPNPIENMKKDVPNEEALKTPEVDEEFQTPCRPLRRNSFSTGSPHLPARNGQFGISRRSNFGFDTSIQTSPIVHAAGRRTLNTLESTTENAPTGGGRTNPHLLSRHHLASFKPDLKKKKLHESVMKSSLPLKATIPFKKVVPMTKNSSTKISPKHTSATTPVNNRNTNTSMHLLIKSGPIADTSTPMHPASAGICNRGSGYSVGGSTSATQSTATLNNNKQRSENAASAMNRKSVPAAEVNRRRSVDAKPKPPMKSTRLSNIGNSAASGTAAGSSSSSRSYLNRPTTTSKQATNSRVSLNSAATNHLANKNKENKQP